jgi:hypothetical protein
MPPPDGRNVLPPEPPPMWLNPMLLWELEAKGTTTFCLVVVLGAGVADGLTQQPSESVVGASVSCTADNFSVLL